MEAQSLECALLPARWRSRSPRRRRQVRRRSRTSRNCWCASASGSPSFTTARRTSSASRRPPYKAVDFNNSLVGFARTVESELRIEADSGQIPGEAAIVRKIRKVNGRVPRERDKKDRAGCTDPSPLSPEPLAFLLPARRSEYQFKTAGMTKDRNRTALMIDFASVDRRSKPELIEARERTRRLLRLVGAHCIEGTHLGRCRKL